MAQTTLSMGVVCIPGDVFPHCVLIKQGPLHRRMKMQNCKPAMAMDPQLIHWLIDEYDFFIAPDRYHIITRFPCFNPVIHEYVDKQLEKDTGFFNFGYSCLALESHETPSRTPTYCPLCTKSVGVDQIASIQSTQCNVEFIRYPLHLLAFRNKTLVIFWNHLTIIVSEETKRMKLLLPWKAIASFLVLTAVAALSRAQTPGMLQLIQL